MFESIDWVVRPSLSSVLVVAFIVPFFFIIQKIIYNLYFHPLAAFPGPRVAGATRFWRAYVECVLNRSFVHVLEELHKTYGAVIRVCPNELHFAQPQAYHDIYNNKNRWDKERRLYQSAGADTSSFGFLTYSDAKERQDALRPMFSTKAVKQAQGLIIDKINALSAAFQRLSEAGKPADLFYGYRCLTIDIITYLCFGHSIDAIEEPEFRAPLVLAMEPLLLEAIRIKHSDTYKAIMTHCPPSLLSKFNPATAGFVDLQQFLQQQIGNLAENPGQISHLPHSMTMYHQLMNEEAYKTKTVPSERSLYEEGVNFLFAGADTTGNALMLGSYYLLKSPKAYHTFKQELQELWPVLEQEPNLQDLENLPYLNAVIKESLRMTTGVVTGLLRIVPSGGAKICETYVPAGTIVSCSSVFVHYDPNIFSEPNEFRPERWLEQANLDHWLVAFSKGPRMCLGMNLAWAELRLSFGYIFRKFDMSLDQSSPDELLWREGFVPKFLGNHVKANMTILTLASAIKLDRGSIAKCQPHLRMASAYTPRPSAATGSIPPTLPPSVETAYRNKCIDLKRRMNEVEESNDAYRLRKVRLMRGIRKMRLERAFLLETLGKRMRKNGHGLNGTYEDSEGSSEGPPTFSHGAVQPADALGRSEDEIRDVAQRQWREMDEEDKRLWNGRYEERMRRWQAETEAWRRRGRAAGRADRDAGDDGDVDMGEGEGRGEGGFTAVNG
ncbi:cytochrome p450 monooxygenase [Lasallia pustulata]|uniref:Cytochrome p450 monooxygenase n=1 Tax=Lasallia pustulata TaxID=136370 RepID=A0A1W5D897_9LECA|nr:cytochrome p450 monooxygenase [Lasallia pustulata]